MEAPTTTMGTFQIRMPLWNFYPTKMPSNFRTGSKKSIQTSWTNSSTTKHSLQPYFVSHTLAQTLVRPILANPGFSFPPKMSKIKIDYAFCSLRSIILILWLIFNSDNEEERSKTILNELEHIDDEADNVGIHVVKINNLELVLRLTLFSYLFPGSFNEVICS